MDLLKPRVTGSTADPSNNVAAFKEKVRTKHVFAWSDQVKTLTWFGEISVMEARLIAALGKEDMKSLIKDMKRAITLSDVARENKERFWLENMDKPYMASVEDGKPNAITAWAALFVQVCETRHSQALNAWEYSNPPPKPESVNRLGEGHGKRKDRSSGGKPPGGTPNPKRSKPGSEASTAPRVAPNEVANLPDGERCSMCGQPKAWHVSQHKGSCPYASDPRRNQSSNAWSKSDVGKAFKALSPSRDWIPKKTGKDNDLIAPKCNNCLHHFNEVLNALANTNLPIISVTLITPQGKRIKRDALVDTGASSNFFSLALANLSI